MTESSAFISKIMLFPVKSLDPIEVRHARVLPSGALQFDRQWGLFDAEGQVVNAKRHAVIHTLRSHLDFDAGTMAVADESGRGLPASVFSIENEQAALEAWLHAYFGFAVHFQTNSEIGFPDDTHSPGPTLISVATLEEIGRWFGLTLEQIRARFRANVEISGVPPFWEDCLFGQVGDCVPFRLGAMTFAGINPCERCIVPARDAQTGELEGKFARRFSELRERTLPTWADRSRFDHFYRVAVNTRLHESHCERGISIGDHLDLVDPAKATATAREAGFGSAQS